MDWLRIIVFSIAALAFAMFMTARIRRKAAKQLSFHDLKTDRDALFFTYVFAVFWLLMTSFRVNWTFLGEPWTGLFYAVCLGIVYNLVRWILRLIDRPKSMTQGVREQVTN
ncbi:MAG: hypothetical protein PHI18_05565 [bacterium]|nr:hypothetical protein [bacterium]